MHSQERSPTYPAISTSDQYDFAPQKLPCESLNPWKPHVRQRLEKAPGLWPHPSLSSQQCHPAARPPALWVHRPGLGRRLETSEATGSPHKVRSRRPSPGVRVWGPEPGLGWGAGVGRKWARRCEQHLFSPHCPGRRERSRALTLTEGQALL